ncbi:hypothetical protein FRC09_007416 [Ceratobasidium sp. 395]|nr:hypothetical protein FRC09_007416 [Ceratobasidium sp. 395]
MLLSSLCRVFFGALLGNLIASAYGLGPGQTNSTYPLPIQLTGSAVYTHDPSIIYNEKSGYYYVFSTHGGVARSKALKGPWVEIGSYLPTGCSIVSSNAGHCDTWAPDVININGTYFVYYSISQFGTQNSVIGVATSKTMEYGSWTDHGAVFSSKPGDNYNAIDANVIQAGGRLLFTFGSYWADIFQFELAPSGLAPLSPSAPQLTHLVLNQTSPQSAEGGFIYKPKQSAYHYLFYSSGGCCAFDPAALPAPGDEYKVYVGRSKSATGPFVDATGKPLTETGGTLVLASHGNIYAPGGNSVFWYEIYVFAKGCTNASISQGS